MSQQVMTPTEQPQPHRRNRRVWGLISLFTVLLIATGTLLFFIFTALFPGQDTSIYANLQSPELLDGGVSAITPPRPVENFTLTAHTGDPFTLTDTRGKAVVLFFGYTHCPDVCPLTLSEMSRVQNQLGPDAERVEFVFVSVDGQRDTPEWLAKYFATRGIDDRMYGLTGPEGDIRRIGADYGLYFQKNTATGSAASYLVDHTASSFLIDPQGRLSAIIGFGTDPAIITDAIYTVLTP